MAEAIVPAFSIGYDEVVAAALLFGLLLGVLVALFGFGQDR